MNKFTILLVWMNWKLNERMDVRILLDNSWLVKAPSLKLSISPFFAFSGHGFMIDIILADDMQLSMSVYAVQMQVDWLLVLIAVTFQLIKSFKNVMQFENNCM